MADGDPADLAVADMPPTLPLFAAPSLVPGVEFPSQHDDGPHLSPDGLRLYFSSFRTGGGGGGANIWVATRPSLGADFASPTPLTELSSATNDSDPTLTDDELLIMFERQGAGGSNDIYQALRAARGDSFGTPTVVASLSTDSEDEDPSLVGDGLSIVFASDRSSPGLNDLWYASRTSRTGPFGAPVALSTLNTAGDEGEPSLHIDGFIVFASERGDVGENDLYIARRLGGVASYEAPTLIDALSSPLSDDDPFVHASLRLIVFSRKLAIGGPGELYWSRY